MDHYTRKIQNSLVLLIHARTLSKSETHAKIVRFRRPITAALHAPFYNHASAGGATHPSIGDLLWVFL